MYAKLFERLPVFDHHVGVHQRSLHVQFEIRLLLFRHLRHQIRDHHVIACHDGVLTAHTVHFTVTQIGHHNAILHVGRINHCAIQAQARGVFRQIQLFVMQSGKNRVFHSIAR